MRIKLFHNESAGDEAHSRENLTKLIEKQGFKVEYASIKEKGWEDIDPKFDILAVAGGDGTVRKLVKKLLERKIIEKTFPIGILPLGTANNIHRFINKETDEKAIIKSWKTGKLKNFDIGLIENFDKNNFFLEGMGYGAFPALIRRMKMHDDTGFEPEEMLKIALHHLYRIVGSYKPKSAKIFIDGKDFSGEYIMVEVVNIPSIGPNLQLASNALADDQQFNIVLIPETERKNLLSYIQNKIQGRESDPVFPQIHGKNIEIEWSGTDCHVDDKLIDGKQFPKIDISVRPSAISFIA